MTKVLLILLSVFSMSASAAELTFQEVMDSVEGTLAQRVTEGVIMSIDLSERTGIIGGYKYWFGTPFVETPLQVFMYQSEGGALELLQTGMKVEVTYGDTGVARFATIIQQLDDDADIEDY